MPLPPISPNRKLNVRKILDENRRQANVVSELDAQGLNIGDVGGDSLDLLRVPRNILAREPAIEATVVNIGNDSVGAFRVVAIVEDFNNDASESDFAERIVGTRALSVRKPTLDDIGNIAILKQALAKDEVGKAYVGGTCLVEMQRWFDTPVLNYADAEAGEDFALARVNGSLRILWEEDDGTNATPRVLPVDIDHFAVVRFTDNYRTVPFNNIGAVSLIQGGPCTVRNPGVDPTKKDYRLEVPTGDGRATVYTVVGGTVAPGATGRAVFAGLPFLAVLDDATGLSGDNYGTATNSTVFTKGKAGFRMIANLGSHDGQDWGVLHYKSPFEKTNYKGFASLDSNSGGGSAGDGTLELIDASGDEKIVVMEFNTPLDRLNGWKVDFSFGATADMNQDDGTNVNEGLIQLTVSCRVQPIIAAFSFSSVTYATRPATQGGPGFTFDLSFTSEDELFAVNADSEIEIGSGTLGSFIQEALAASSSGMFYGLEFQLLSLGVQNSSIDTLKGKGTVQIAGFAFRL